MARQRRDIGRVREQPVDVRHHGIRNRARRLRKRRRSVGVGLVRLEEDRRPSRASRLEVHQRLHRRHQRVALREGVRPEESGFFAVAEQKDHAPLQPLAREHPRNLKPNRDTQSIVARARRCGYGVIM